MLVNETLFDWVKMHEHSYQMNNWSLPAKIPAWSSQQVYVEFSGPLADNTRDDGADTTYAFQGSGSTLSIGARGRPGFYLFAEIDGTTFSLGWNQDSTTSFALTGQPGSWIWSNMNGSSWMQDNLAHLGPKTLRDIAIPGAHDAGMSINASGGTAAANANNTIAQSMSIAGQLAMGTRFFDIRPVISAGQFVTGHYSYALDTAWQGQNGQSILSVIHDINAFTGQQEELIVLYLSHSLNTDVGVKSYRPFEQSEWDELFKLLDALNHRFSALPTVDPTKLPLKHFIGAGSFAVVIIVEDTDPPVDLGSRQGLFSSKNNFTIYNEYSETNDLATMVNDQIVKMADEKDSYFLLSWTLTQSDVQAAGTTTAEAIGSVVGSAAGPIGTLAGGFIGSLIGDAAVSSILDLGSEANNALMANLL